MRLLAAVALATLALATAFLWLANTQSESGARAQAPLPVYLDIASANIIETSVVPTDVTNRPVILRLELAGAPRCTANSTFLAYGFLVDADKNTTTGLTGPAFAGLGVDARLSAECNPSTGRLTSPLGPVEVTTDAASGVIKVEIRTTVGQLPSIDFNWIAFAQEGSTFSRLPKEPEVGHWTTFERTLY